MKLTSPQKIWLYGVCLLILLMVAVGGITRLTGSGLSIVEWKPVSGILPPLNHAQWEQEFEAYKQFPEYKKVNRAMSLDEFKWIFFWEYIHRLLGRLIGLVFFLPMAYFWLKGQLSRPLKRKLLGIFVLGGLQGIMGWYMVKSGLVHEPRVSHFRLAAHLSLAFLVFAAIYWTLLQGSVQARSGTPPKTWPRIITGLLALQIVYGAFVAGLRAGYAYNTFPTMNGMWFPNSFFALSPWFVNFFSNPAAVQFIHRSIAWLLLIAVSLYVIHSLKRRDHTNRTLSLSLLAVTMIQFFLGVFTLLTHVHIVPATLHQVTALLLLMAALNALYQPKMEKGQIAPLKF